MELKCRTALPLQLRCCLLIAPYGIEIPFFLYKSLDLLPLLIAPYGIEIGDFADENKTMFTFNRTLWN